MSVSEAMPDLLLEGKAGKVDGLRRQAGEAKHGEAGLRVGQPPRHVSMPGVRAPQDERRAEWSAPRRLAMGIDSVGAENQADEGIDEPDPVRHGVLAADAGEEERMVARRAEDRTPEKDAPPREVADAPHAVTGGDDSRPELVIGRRRRVVENHDFHVRARDADDQRRLDRVQEVRRHVKEVPRLIALPGDKNHRMFDHLVTVQSRLRRNAPPGAIAVEDVLEVLARKEVEPKPLLPVPSPFGPRARAGEIAGGGGRAEECSRAVAVIQSSPAGLVARPEA